MMDNQKFKHEEQLRTSVSETEHQLQGIKRSSYNKLFNPVFMGLSEAGEEIVSFGLFFCSAKRSCVHF